MYIHVYVHMYVVVLIVPTYVDLYLHIQTCEGQTYICCCFDSTNVVTTISPHIIHHDDTHMYKCI